MYAVVEVIIAEGIATIAEACRFLDVNRTAFHAWRVAEPTVSQEQEEQLTPLIRILFKKHRRRYGARRIACELRESGHVCSPKKVSKVLKTQGLRAIQPKSFVPKTTDSRHRLGYSPNLLLDATEPTGINRVWVGDITYIPIQGGTFCYLASLMDLFSRRIVGWHLKDDMTESLVLAALRSAIKERQPLQGLIHHTDRGGQYAGTDYCRRRLENVAPGGRKTGRCCCGGDRCGGLGSVRRGFYWVISTCRCRRLSVLSGESLHLADGSFLRQLRGYGSGGSGGREWRRSVVRCRALRSSFRTAGLSSP